MLLLLLQDFTTANVNSCFAEIFQIGVFYYGLSGDLKVNSHKAMKSLETKCFYMGGRKEEWRREMGENLRKLDTGDGGRTDESERRDLG